MLTWYLDGDSDGFGDPSTASSSCSPPSGTVSEGGDCDDEDAAVNPGAAEIAADGVDQDCDGRELCHFDADGDGYTGGTVRSDDMDCSDEGEVSSPSGESDCDDSDPDVHPGAAEVVGDEVDQDCDGGETCFGDLDGDGAVDRSETVSSPNLDCSDSGEGSASDPEDCDDSDSDTWPGAADNDSAVACMTDADDDGYGADDPASSVVAGPDCDDGDAASSPGAEEIVGDEVDEDCDTTELCYVDLDDDGFRPGDSVVRSDDVSCRDGGEANSGDPDGDCDDDDATVYPGAAEVAGDGIDQDCDGSDQSGRGDQPGCPGGCEGGGGGGLAGLLGLLGLVGLRRGQRTVASQERSCPHGARSQASSSA